MERSLQKKPKRKPQLVIETSESNNDNKSFKRKSLYKNEVQIKPLMSAKNRHQLKGGFNFPSVSQTQHNQNDKHQVKIRFLQKLQNEKTELMRSLQILKEGAVSAIIEKEEEIQKLKEHIYVEQATMSRKSIEKDEQEQLAQKLSQKQLELKEIYQKELEQEVQELRKELRKQRIRFESELYEKQQMINSLCVELNDSYNRIESMERDDKLLNQKLKSIELQNISLLKELQTSQHLTSSQQLNNSFFLNISNVTQKSRHKSQVSEDAYFEDVGDSSYATIPIKKYSEHILMNQDDDYLSNSFISQRIESIKEKHKKQVDQIKEHYQSELVKLRKKYEHHESEKNSSRRKNSDNSNSLKRMGSVESLRSMGSSHRQSEQNHKIPRFRKSPSASTLSHHPDIKPLSLQNLNLQQRMQSIIEHGEYDEAGTPRYSLKQQIMQQEICPSSSLMYQNYDTVTNISNLQNYFNNKNSSQRNFNYDTISQFTANHFEYPMNIPERDVQKLFLRTNSIATFQGFTDDAQTKTTKNINSLQEKICSFQSKDKVLSKSPSNVLSVQDSQVSNKKFIQHSESEQDDDKLSTKSQASSQKSSKSTLKKDIMMFCMGLVTGGTLIKVGNKIFNK